MSKGDVNIRFYQPGDDLNIVKLLKQTFPKWEKFPNPLELWRWKYIDTPLQSLIVVAEAKNNIIGCSHELIFKAKLGPEETYLTWGDDLAIDPEYRGQGIWTKMRTHKQKHIEEIAKYSFSTTVNPIVLNSWIKRNVSLLPFTVTRMVKTKNLDHVLKQIRVDNITLVKIGYMGLSILNKLSNIFKPRIKRQSEFKIIQTGRFDENIDLFWRKIREDYNFILEKKHEYLNWRFQDNDRGKHAKFIALDGKEVLGYIVVGYKPGMAEGYVEDLIAHQGRLDVVDELLRRGCSYLDGLGLESIFYQVVLDHQYQKHFTRHGFIDSRSRPSVSFDYVSNWSEDLHSEIPFLKATKPSQVYFNYATTI